MLQREGEFLVNMARKVFITFLRRFEIDPLPGEIPEKLREKSGVFVRVGRNPDSLWTRDIEIIGCLGYPLPSRELIVTTIDSALALAVRIGSSALFDISENHNFLFEVSVLTKPELVKVRRAIDYLKEIKVGRDGLLVEQGFIRGLILPQIPIENDWDEKDLISECCMKAGLLADLWLTSPEISVYKFQAEIFRETGAERKVVKVDLTKGVG